jgi:hypothetical protein
MKWLTSGFYGLKIFLFLFIPQTCVMGQVNYTANITKGCSPLVVEFTETNQHIREEKL